MLNYRSSEHRIHPLPAAEKEGTGGEGEVGRRCPRFVYVVLAPELLLLYGHVVTGLVVYFELRPSRFSASRPLRSILSRAARTPFTPVLGVVAITLRPD